MQNLRVQAAAMTPTDAPPDSQVAANLTPRGVNFDTLVKIQPTSEA